MTARAGELSPDVTADPTNWTNRLRGWFEGLVPPGQALPARQPVYVASWIYVFGVLTLTSLVVVVASGCVLALGGVAWWHVSSVGHFFNSVHLWSVEMFFGFMVVHLWGKFWMAAWRGKRALTWITGVVLFGISIGTSFTGFLVTVQLQRAVDRRRGQGRDQLDRRGRVLQRAQPRADAALARGAPASGRGPAHTAAHHLGPTPRRRPAPRRRTGGLSHESRQHPGLA